MDRPLRATMRNQALAVGIVAALGCEAGVDAGNEVGALVKVEGRTITTANLQTAREQLAPYGRARFSGPQGERALLAQLVDLELLAGQARSAGLFDRAIVEWSIVDALAQRQARAVTERRVPRESIAQDESALRAYIRDHRDTLWVPERRSAWFGTFDDWAAAQDAHAAWSHEQMDPEHFERFGVTRPMTQDLESFGTFHRLLFDSELEPGQWLAGPVTQGQAVWVARLEQIVPPEPFSLQDPVQRAQVIDAAIEAPQQAALDAYLEQLRVRWPVVEP